MFVALCIAITPALPAYAASRCYAPAAAIRHPHHKLCVKAHVYREIKLEDGTRILDICSPRIPAANCRFAFISLPAESAAVGSLQKYVGKEIKVRGRILPLHGRAEIALSRAWQLSIARPPLPHSEEARAGSGKFRPNPELLKGFNASQAHMPIADPAFRSSTRN